MLSIKLTGKYAQVESIGVITRIEIWPIQKALMDYKDGKILPYRLPY